MNAANEILNKCTNLICRKLIIFDLFFVENNLILWIIKWIYKTILNKRGRGWKASILADAVFIWVISGELRNSSSGSTHTSQDCSKFAVFLQDLLKEKKKLCFYHGKYKKYLVLQRNWHSPRLLCMCVG